MMEDRLDNLEKLHSESTKWIADLDFIRWEIGYWIKSGPSFQTAMELGRIRKRLLEPLYSDIKKHETYLSNALKGISGCTVMGYEQLHDYYRIRHEEFRANYDRIASKVKRKK